MAATHLSVLNLVGLIASARAVQLGMRRIVVLAPDSHYRRKRFVYPAYSPLLSPKLMDQGPNMALYIFEPWKIGDLEKKEGE